VDLPVVEEGDPTGDVGADEGVGGVALAGGDRGDPCAPEADREDEQARHQCRFQRIERNIVHLAWG
jgi:hypothetical protein